MKPEDFFGFDPETGEWKNKAVGLRFVLLGESFYVNMIVNLSKQFGSAAGVFIYQSGLGVGLEMGNLVKNAPDLQTGIKGLLQNIFIAGWGKMSLEDSDVDLSANEPVAIIEENGFFSYLCQREGVEYLTPFVNGVLTGLFDTLRDIEHTCEREIISQNPLKCRYVVTPLS